jgi:hypothetical protein
MTTESAAAAGHLPDGTPHHGPANGHNHHLHQHAENPHHGPPQRWWQTVAVLVSAMMITAVITLVLTHWIDSLGATARNDQRMEDFAKQIKELSEKKADSSLFTNQLDTDEVEIDSLKEKKADATLLQNLINTQNVEITALRNSVSNILVSLNSFMGKYDTFVPRTSVDITGLTNDVCQLNRAVAKLEAGADFQKNDAARYEKLAAELSAFKDKLAVIEANLSIKKRQDEKAQP